MATKIISSAAINALKEALTYIYWYKNDLHSFINNTVDSTYILAKLNWDDKKRDVVTQLINFMARNQEVYQKDILKLMSEVIRINDFSHLKRLDEGLDKARKAEESVNALRKLAKGHFDIFEEQNKIEERKKIAYEAIKRKQGIREKIGEIKAVYYSMISSTDPRARGYKLEKMMKELFELFDLDPKASFKIEGEQIDGAFTFDNTDYLFEARWQKELVNTHDLAAFSEKLSRKLDNTLGLFLSINGFSDTAVKKYSDKRSFVILMDGADLMAVLEERIDLDDLLLRKRRHAAQTGNIYLRVKEIFLELS